MNRNYLPVFILLITLAFGARGQSLTWQKVYSLHDKEVASSVAQTADGGYIVAGYTGSGYDTSDMWILRLNAAGDTLWTKLLDFEKVDWALSVTISSDSSYVMAGFTSPNSVSSGTIMKVLKLSRNGDILWTFTDTITGLIAGDVVQPPGGGYTLFGCNYDGNPDTIAVIRLRENGQEDWRRIYQGLTFGIIYQMKPTRDTGYILAGQIYSDSITGYDNYLMRLNHNCDTVWTKIFGTVNWDIAYAVEEDMNGHYLVATAEDYGANTILYSVGEDGSILDIRTYGLGTGSYLYALSKTDDGGFIASGVAGTAFTDHGLLVMRFDAAGDSLWTRVYQQVQYAWSDDIHQTMDEGYIVAGTVSYNYGNNSDMWILKLDESGLVGIRDNPADAMAAGISISPNPCTTTAAIRYSLINASVVTISIYDASGRKVDEPVRSFQAPGSHCLQWDAGKHRAGLYCCHIKTDDKAAMLKLMVTK